MTTVSCHLPVLPAVFYHTPPWEVWTGMYLLVELQFLCFCFELMWSATVQRKPTGEGRSCHATWFFEDLMCRNVHYGGQTSCVSSELGNSGTKPAWKARCWPPSYHLGERIHPLQTHRIFSLVYLLSPVKHKVFWHWNVTIQATCRCIFRPSNSRSG